MNYRLTSDKKQIIDSSIPIQPIQMNIFLSVTTNHLDKLKPLLYSLLKYSQSKFNVYIMLDTCNIQSYYQFFKQFQTERMTIKLFNNFLLKSFLNKNLIRFLTDMAYGRMLIPTLITNADRVLYLDYDTLVINRGIEWLYNLDFKDQYIISGGERDTNLFDYNKTYEGLKDYFGDDREYNQYQLFHHLTKYYFNSGVLLFNNKKIREDEKNIQLLNLLKTPPKSDNNEILAEVKRQMNYDGILSFYYHDQSLLNWLFRNNKVFFNPIFNSYNIGVYENNITTNDGEYFSKWGFKNKQEYVDNIIIAHYTGWDKPWLNKQNLSIYKKQLQDKYNNILGEMRND